MMDVTTLPATRRTHLGSKHTRRIRQNGQIPAIIYGHKQDPVPIALDAHEIELLLLHHSRVISVDLDSKSDQYLIKAVQYDHLDTTPIHLDLVRVDMDEKVEVEVEVVLRGTPAGAHDGGILLQQLNTVLVECTVTAIPESIKHSIIDLALGGSVHVKDLQIPAGVTVLNDPDDLIATCREPSAEVEEEAVEGEGAEGGSEPEVIGKKPDEDSSDES
ncbi:MAG: 50S ribosomal protein L25 [Phycisphaerales bacterium]|nr:50S ribosomal protein L25 [Phycisphaerales bacterium]